MAKKGKMVHRKKNFRGQYDAKLKRDELKEARMEDSKKFPQKGSRDVLHEYNDASWYANNPKLLRDAASFSYNTPLGAPFRLRTLLNPGTAGPLEHVSPRYSSVPGLMSIEIIPTVGVALDAQAPVNVAAQDTYSFVRYKNSGGANYDAPDLMLYLLAMDSIYGCWNAYKRLYGFIATYNQLNRYMPRAYVKAMNVDFDDLIQHLADFRAYLNMTAAKITAFCVPATFTYNVRHSWLYSNIYKDSNTQKAQQYMFVPAGFYQYDETSSPEGGLLTFQPFTGTTTPRKYSSLVTYMDNMLNALQYSEDIGIMSGDILKAYGQGNLFKLSAVDPEYVVEPVYNEEVLNQIHNLVMVRSDSYDDLSIVQDPNTNFIKFNPTFTAANGVIPNASGILLNMPWDDVTPENSMVGSRLSAIVDYVNPTSGTGPKHFVTVGSEFVSNIYIWYMANSSATSDAIYTSMDVQKMQYYQYLPMDTGTAVTPAMTYVELLTLIANLSNFDWHPITYLAYRNNASPGTTNETLCGVLADMNNYTIVSEDDVIDMNLTALLSEFNVPNDGSHF